ncbi:hypothetical protein HT031_002071 [Scenedesmus sp. PABB004]|nr:hypothetical protein HT031_002071 [Scenedesmus sp. PABB004]
MEDPMIVVLFQAAVKSGLFSTVCRYNMRGAGNSKAKWTKASLDPLFDPHMDDFIAVCQHLLSGGPSPPTTLFVAGYSYGACVAASGIEYVPAVAGYVGIGFPLGGAANLALRSRQHWAHLADTQIPKLVVHGTRDKYGALTTLREFAAQYHAAEPEPGPLDLAVIDGADHFFAGLWDEVAQKTLAWIGKRAEQLQAGGA